MEIDYHIIALRLRAEQDSEKIKHLGVEMFRLALAKELVLEDVFFRHNPIS